MRCKFAFFSKIFIFDSMRCVPNKYVYVVSYFPLTKLLKWISLSKTRELNVSAAECAMRDVISFLANLVFIPRPFVDMEDKCFFSEGAHDGEKSSSLFFVPFQTRDLSAL